MWPFCDISLSVHFKKSDNEFPHDRTVCGKILASHYSPIHDFAIAGCTEYITSIGVVFGDLHSIY